MTCPSVIDATVYGCGENKGRFPRLYFEETRWIVSEVCGRRDSDTLGIDETSNQNSFDNSSPLKQCFVVQHCQPHPRNPLQDPANPHVADLFPLMRLVLTIGKAQLRNRNHLVDFGHT